jgi:hypothetical protein
MDFYVHYIAEFSVRHVVLAMISKLTDWEGTVACAHECSGLTTVLQHDFFQQATKHDTSVYDHVNHATDLAMRVRRRVLCLGARSVLL